MKKMLLSLTLLLGLTLTLNSCKTNTPKAVADKFLSSLYHYDYESAKEVSTEETKKMLDMIAQFSDAMPDSMRKEAQKIKIKIKDVKEENDKATVLYEISDEPTEKTIHLVKQEGKWLVQWSKMDAEAGAEADLNSAPPAEEVPAQTPAAPPADGTAVDTSNQSNSTP